jgi:type IV fimbrial biogenesis protein FimT
MRDHRTILDGLWFGEGPRWHDDALFFSDMHGHRVVFCPSTEGRRCSGETRWESGWLLGDDRDGDHQPDGDPLYVGNPYDSNLIISSNQGRAYVRFDPEGMASGSNITLLICARSSSREALSVVVSNSGRIRGAPATQAQASTCSSRGKTDS